MAIMNGFDLSVTIIIVVVCLMFTICYVAYQFFDYDEIAYRDCLDDCNRLIIKNSTDNAMLVACHITC